MKENALLSLKSFEQIRQSFKDVYFTNKLNDNDFRGQYVNQVDKTIIVLNLNLINFHDNLCNKQEFDKILPTSSNYDYQEVLKTYFNQTKASFIYNLSSITERFFRILFSSLSNLTSITNIEYYKVTDLIFKKLNLEKNNYWVALMILSNIRNTIHNNGIHVKEDRTFKYHEFNLVLIKGFPQGIADYQILILIINDIMGLFIKIIRHEKVIEKALVNDKSFK
jgi:hypothetical protein